MPYVTGMVGIAVELTTTILSVQFVNVTTLLREEVHLVVDYGNLSLKATDIAMILTTTQDVSGMVAIAVELTTIIVPVQLVNV